MTKKSEVTSYADALDRIRYKSVHTLKEVGDQWMTPDDLVSGIQTAYAPIAVDLFTDRFNSVARDYFTVRDNALTQSWLEKWESSRGLKKDPRAVCWGQPPYSRAHKEDGKYVTGMREIMKKAYEEHQAGCPQIWLVKSAVGELWWPGETCTHIIHIRGRLTFDLPFWFKNAELKAFPGGFSASLIFFDGMSEKRTKPDGYVDRDYLLELGRKNPVTKRPYAHEWAEQQDDDEL